MGLLDGLPDLAAVLACTILLSLAGLAWPGWPSRAGLAGLACGLLGRLRRLALRVGTAERHLGVYHGLTPPALDGHASDGTGATSATQPSSAVAESLPASQPPERLPPGFPAGTVLFGMVHSYLTV